MGQAGKLREWIGPVADNLPAITAEPGAASKARGWSFVSDGPPLLLVALIFASLLSLWLAPGSPAMLAVMLGGALVLAVALEYRRWGLDLPLHDGVVHTDVICLRRRLDAARARQIERNRWR